MKIGIFGDSWSCQAWAKSPNSMEVRTEVTFQKLLEPHGIQVENYSKESSSNQDIETAIKKFAHSGLDAMVVFQTDPLRNLIEKKELKIIAGYNKPADSLDLMCANISNDFYQEILKVQQQIQKPCIIVGGLSKLCHERLPDSFLSLPNSWTEMVATEFKDCYYEYIEPTLLIFETFRKTYGWGDLADFFEIEKKISAKNWIWQNNNNFGWCHPGVGAYQIMADALVQKLRSIR